MDKMVKSACKRGIKVPAILLLAIFLGILFIMEGFNAGVAVSADEKKPAAAEKKDDKKTDEKPAEKKDDKAPAAKPGDVKEEKVDGAAAPVADEAEGTAYEFNPDDPLNPIYLGSYGEKRSTGDPNLSGYASEAARLGAGWHPKGIDIDVLPKDKFGLINWVELVNKGAIKPQGIFPGAKTKENMVLNLNILFKMKGGFVDNVVFPHDTHSYWLDCTNCHNAIFFQFAGWNAIQMQEIVKGEWCGRCHGRVAFPVSDCTRCHKYPTGHEIEKTATHRRPKPR